MRKTLRTKLFFRQPRVEVISPCGVRIALSTSRPFQRWREGPAAYYLQYLRGREMLLEKLGRGRYAAPRTAVRGDNHSHLIARNANSKEKE